MDKYLLKTKVVETEEQKHAREKREERIKYVNENIFYNKSFRSMQKEIIDTVLLDEDCFVIMPTGGGKSLCYQLPAVLSKGVSVVISPLLSLVEDQVSSLIKQGIPAAYLSSTSSELMVNQVFRDLARGDQGLEPYLKLLYITPERMVKNLTTKRILSNLYQNEMLARFVIDEAHCVSHWGHDFRKEYGQLHILKQDYPDVPIIALTATARQNVAADTKKILRITHAREFSLGYDRPNLMFEVCEKPGKKTDANQFVLYLIGTFPIGATGILYCMTKADCEQLADFLRSNGIMADYYHSGMAKGAKQMVQAKWLSGEIHVVCATIAYGMGIDKSDVRYVIHLSLAKSMEGYYQEAGRAGRDGLRSECILLYRQEDASALARIMSLGSGNKLSKKDEDRLEEMVAYCMESTACRRLKFCETFSGNKCGQFIPCDTMCDNCLSRTQRRERRQFIPVGEVIDSTKATKKQEKKGEPRMTFKTAAVCLAENKVSSGSSCWISKNNNTPSDNSREKPRDPFFITSNSSKRAAQQVAIATGKVPTGTKRKTPAAVLGLNNSSRKSKSLKSTDSCDDSAVIVVD